MLWYKGWLETRFRLLFVPGLVALFAAAQRFGIGQIEARGVIFTAGLSVWAPCIMLAAAGIATQQSLQAAKGLHGSTLFTLTLPVSRLRLLAIRASLGWLETAGGIVAVCCFLWFLFPELRAKATPEEMIEYAVVLIACGSFFYCITVCWPRSSTTSGACGAA